MLNPMKIWVCLKLMAGTQMNKRSEDLQIYYKRRKIDLEELQPEERPAAIGVNEGHVMSSIMTVRSVIHSSDELTINSTESFIQVLRLIDHIDTGHADADYGTKDIGKGTSSNKKSMVEFLRSLIRA